jgi:hypothetical protein
MSRNILKFIRQHFCLQNDFVKRKDKSHDQRPLALAFSSSGASKYLLLCSFQIAIAKKVTIFFNVIRNSIEKELESFH